MHGCAPMTARGLVVVTGADGFTGRAACAHLRAAGVPVRGLVRALSTRAPPRGRTSCRSATSPTIADDRARATRCAARAPSCISPAAPT